MRAILYTRQEDVITEGPVLEEARWIRVEGERTLVHFNSKADRRKAQMATRWFAFNDLTLVMRYRNGKLCTQYPVGGRLIFWTGYRCEPDAR